MFTMISESVMKNTGIDLSGLPAEASLSNYPVVGATMSTGNFIVYVYQSLFIGGIFGGILSALSVLFYIPVFIFVIYEIYTNYSLIVSYKSTDAYLYPNTYYMSTFYTFVTAWFVYFLLTMPLQFVMGLLFSIP